MIKLGVRQAIDLSGISIESLRHWRRVLPPLYGRGGYVAGFSPADILFLLAVRSLVKDLGIPVGSLTEASWPLHAYLAKVELPIRPGEKLAISLAANEIASGSNIDSLEPPFVVLPLHQLVSQLQAAWAEDRAQTLRLGFDIKSAPIGREVH